MHWQCIGNTLVLSESQSGFRPGFSTNTCMSVSLDGLCKGKLVGMVLFDLQKPFDCVDHEILLEKLWYMVHGGEIGGMILFW